MGPRSHHPPSASFVVSFFCVHPPALYIVVVQTLSPVQLFAIPWTAARQPPLSFTISWSLLKFMSIESVMLSNHLILCRPLLPLTSIFASIRVYPYTHAKA